MIKKKTPMTPRERQASSRKNKVKKGFKQINIWMSKTTIKQLNSLASLHESDGRQSTVEEALSQLYEEQQKAKPTDMPLPTKEADPGTW